MEYIGKLFTIFSIMFKIGLFTFGGGWGIVVQMQEEFAQKRGWLNEEQITDYLSLSRSFPGIMIINMSVISGYKMAGIPGAVASAFGLSTPAILVMAVFTLFYSKLRDNVYVAKILNGIRSCVVPILVVASMRIWRAAMKYISSYFLMAAAAALCLFTDVSKPLIVILAFFSGLIMWRGKVDKR